MSPIEFAIGSLLASAVAGAIARPILLSRGIVDRPNARSSHDVPTVRGGGTGFVLVILAACIFVASSAGDLAWLAIVATAGLLAIVSFVDDVRGLGATVRLLVHAMAASVLTWFVVQGSPLPSFSGTLLLASVTLVGSVGYTNAFNFMDGIDGIASLQAVLAAFGTAAVLRVAGSETSSPTLLVATVVGASVLGFLPWNFPRARMFMGDVGSATLGYLLSALVVRGVLEHGLVLLLPLALPHAGFVLDTGITFVRRLRRGERVAEAHREHFYQRFVRSGLAHPPVSLLYAACTLVSCLCGVALVGADQLTSIVVTSLVVALWLSVFAFAERRFNRPR